METISVGEAEGIGIAVFGIMIFISILFTALYTVIYCMMFHKAGYPWALGLLMLVPVANLVMMLYLAFGDWPVRKELRRLRQQQPSVV